MQLSVMRSRVEIILQDTQNDRWSNAEIDQSINDAYLEFCRKTRILQVNSKMTAAAGPAVYSPASARTVNDITVMSSGGIRLDRATLIEIIDMFGDDWMTVSGAPQYYVHPYDQAANGNPRTLVVPNPGGITLTFSADLVASNSVSGAVGVTDISGAVTTTNIGPIVFTGDSATTLGLIATALAAVTGIASATVSGNIITITETAEYRVQVSTFTVTLGASQATVTTTIGVQDLKFYGTAIPAVLSADVDVPVIHEMYHESLVWGAVSRCYMKDFEYADPNKMQFYETKYQGVIAEASRMVARGFDRGPKMTKTSFC